MSKVTSKRQVTVPKKIAERYGIGPGSELDWQPAGDAIRVIPPGRPTARLTVAERLALFDAATLRQRGRDAQAGDDRRADNGRGWRREDLYGRARASGDSP